MHKTWVDQWDEKRAQEGDRVKSIQRFDFGSDLLGSLPSEKLDSSSFFDLASNDCSQCVFSDGWLKFPSAIETETEENNAVSVKVTEGNSQKALVVFHHWNATSRQSNLAKFLAWQGFTVVEIAMPYHFERRRPGALYADYMISPNIGRTLRSMKQAVLDGKRLVCWLKQQHYIEISVLGFSLGSWVAGLVAAHDSNVTKASLFLSAGSLADMVWTGRATRLIRKSLEPSISLAQLRTAWALLDLENYSSELSRSDLRLQLVLASRDKVVLPDLSNRLISSLKPAHERLDVVKLNCGHYSMSLPPSNILAGARLLRFLRQS